MKIELFISDKDNNSIKYTERIYNTLVTSYIQFLSHSEMILVYIFPKSNNYSITDTMLSSYFQIRAKFHPYIRDRSKVSSWCKTQLKRLASWRLAKERKIIHLKRARADVRESILKLIGVYRVITGERDDRDSARIRHRAGFVRPLSHPSVSTQSRQLCYFITLSTIFRYM